MIYKVESKNKNHDKKNLNFPLNSHFQKEIVIQTNLKYYCLFVLKISLTSIENENMKV